MKDIKELQNRADVLFKEDYKKLIFFEDHDRVNN